MLCTDAFKQCHWSLSVLSCTELFDCHVHPCHPNRSSSPAKSCSFCKNRLCLADLPCNLRCIERSGLSGGKHDERSRVVFKNVRNGCVLSLATTRGSGKGVYSPSWSSENHQPRNRGLWDLFGRRVPPMVSWSWFLDVACSLTLFQRGFFPTK